MRHYIVLENEKYHIIGANFEPKNVIAVVPENLRQESIDWLDINSEPNELGQFETKVKINTVKKKQIIDARQAEKEARKLAEDLEKDDRNKILNKLKKIDTKEIKTMADVQDAFDAIIKIIRKMS